MSARSRVAALAAAATVALSGCTATGWVAEAPPAAGTQGEVTVSMPDNATATDKARNVLLVTDGEGRGLLVGTVSSVPGAKVTGVAFAPEKADGSQGEPVAVDFTATIPAQGSVRFEDGPARVESPDLTPGRLAKGGIQLSSGTIQLEAPVYASDHPDFRELWSKAA